jgi:hypothetical protein
MVAVVEQFPSRELPAVGHLFPVRARARHPARPEKHIGAQPRERNLRRAAERSPRSGKVVSAPNRTSPASDVVRTVAGTAGRYPRTHGI